MFKKVLIAEDQQLANISLQKTLEELGVSNRAYAHYCDQALTYLKKACQSEYPFELLVTDLYFDEDGEIQQLKNGMDLIKAARDLQPSIKILVFSAEIRPSVISQLFSHYGIDGYVRKARRDAEELRTAISTLYSNRKHLSPELRITVNKKNDSYTFPDFDKTIISLLAQGTLQKNIPGYLQAHNITPSGLSSIEKRLNLIKESLGFTTNQQLIAYCKDQGII